MNKFKLTEEQRLRLRDEFAMTFVSTFRNTYDTSSTNAMADLASDAYTFADIMFAERNN